MSSPPASLIQTIQPALFLLVPLFSTALVLLSISHKPHPGAGPSVQALLAYTSIAALTVLSTLSGALPLSHNSNPHTEALIQALLFLLLGIPVLHLPQTYAYTHSNDHNTPPRSILVLRLGLAHTALLVITLSSATLLAFLIPYLPQQAPPPTANPLYYLPPALFLAYSLLALLRLIFALNQRSPSGIRPFEFPTARTRNPIVIQVATARTIPLTLPSPASTASFPLSGHHSHSDDQSHEIGLPASLSRIPQRSGHEKVSSISSSTLTATAVDHHTRESSEHTSANHGIFTFSPQSVARSAISPRLSSDGHHWGEGYYPESAVHQRQLFDSRSRSLFVFFIAAQLTVSVAYSSTLATGISSVDHPLNILKAACIVLAVTATMSGYLLHAYNSPFLLSRSPSSSSSSSGSSSGNPFSLSERHPFYSRPDASPNINYDSEINTIQMVEARPQVALIQLASPLSRKKRADADLSLPQLTKTNSTTKLRPFADTDAWNPKSPPSELARTHSKAPAELLTDDFDQVLDIGHVQRGTVRVNYGQPKELGQAAVCESEMEAADPFTEVFETGKDTERKGKEQDASLDPLRRGSLPVPPSKMLGWEFGCAPLPATNVKGKESTTPSPNARTRKRITITEGLESLLKNRRGSIKRANAGQSPLPPLADMTRGSTINRQKSKKVSSIHGRKKSTGSRPCTPDSAVVMMNSHSHDPTSPSTTLSGWCEAVPATFSGNLDTWDVESSPIVPTTAHRTMMLRKSSSSSGSGRTEDSCVTEDIDRGAGRGGLAFKRSFRLGVGRTLSPGLTLAAASGIGGVSRSRSRGERREEMVRSEESVVEEDEDEEGKIQSVAVPRRGSSPYGRIMEASTVAATPATGSTSPHSSIPSFTSATAIHDKRGRLTSLVTTSATTRRSTSPSSFSTSPITPTSSLTWISHPFIEFSEPAGANYNIDDGSISLEKEMEDMRIGRVKGESKVDVFGNSGISTGLPVPSTSQAGAGPLLPTPATTPERPKSRTGGLSRKLGLSSNKECDQSSTTAFLSPPLPQGSPYRFPMIFSGAPSSTNSIVNGSAPNLSRAPSSRLSSKKMGSVRSAFAGVGARMSKMSVNSGAEGSMRSGTGRAGPESLEDDGDFMDLRDPFAAPLSFSAARRGGKESEKRDFLPMDASLGVGKEDFEVGSSSGRRSGGRMSAWGRLPVPVKSTSPTLAGKKPGKLASCGRTGDRRKHKKEKRARKRTMSGLGAFKITGPGRVGEEDIHLDIEEALLAQQLLKKLDLDEWVGRA